MFGKKAAKKEGAAPLDVRLPDLDAEVASHWSPAGAAVPAGGGPPQSQVLQPGPEVGPRLRPAGRLPPDEGPRATRPAAQVGSAAGAARLRADCPAACRADPAVRPRRPHFGRRGPRRAARLQPAGRGGGGGLL